MGNIGGGRRAFRVVRAKCAFLLPPLPLGCLVQLHWRLSCNPVPACLRAGLGSSGPGQRVYSVSY